MESQNHSIIAAEPLMVTLYAKSGRVLMRVRGLRQGNGFDVPKDIRKRVARTETIDANGVVVDQWTAPWAVEA